MKTFETAEAVTCGHPDKLCDRVADAILDALLQQDRESRAAIEAAAAPGQLLIFGEVSSRASVDYRAIARRVIAESGYTESEDGFGAESCEIAAPIHPQSPDIARGIVKRSLQNSGAGDQGTAVGYACRETELLMPLPIVLAHRLAGRLESARESGELPYLRPDGKTQVTVEYEDGSPRRVSTVVVSAQHREDVPIDVLREDVQNRVIAPALPAALLDDRTEVYVNPTGRFVLGGPGADAGVTGRKTAADAYGSCRPCGDGSFSGKDGTKPDRCGGYLARYLAKNIVAAGLADRCQVTLSYAIALAEPVALSIEDFGTGRVPPEKIRSYLLRHLDMRPNAVIRRFGLARPIYESLACRGQVGENAAGMPWERCDLTEKLRRLLRESDAVPAPLKEPLRSPEHPNNL